MAVVRCRWSNWVELWIEVVIHCNAHWLYNGDACSYDFVTLTALLTNTVKHVKLMLKAWKPSLKLNCWPETAFGQVRLFNIVKQTSSSNLVQVYPPMAFRLAVGVKYDFVFCLYLFIQFSYLFICFIRYIFWKKNSCAKYWQHKYFFHLWPLHWV